MKLDWNGDKILAALRESFTETNQVMGRNFAKAIDDPVWPWPNETQRHKTKRRKGKLVGSPRNIVDRGELKGSYQPQPGVEGRDTFGHAWTANHAMAVHSGAVFKDGSTLPARPWVDVTLRDHDTAEIFAKIATPKLDAIK